jgi:F0F1-type ATP synthase epsilon subunit
MFSSKTWIGIALLAGVLGVGAVYLVTVKLDISSPSAVRIDQQQLDEAADRAGERAAEELRAATQQDRREAEERRRAHDQEHYGDLPGWGK